MRCQRGQYVIDDWLVPGDIYKCDKMTEWTQKEGVLDLEGNAKVELVISRRWLRMKWRGADRWEGKMGKGLVLVRVPEEEDEEEEEGGKGKEKEDVIEVDSEYEAEPKKGKVGKLVDV